MIESLIEKLQGRFAQSLPGYEAQKIMEPPMRNSFSLDQSNAKVAATILGLFFDKEWTFILIERSSHPLDKHKGQISFPGGQLEKGETPANAATREAKEEIGIPIENIQLIGTMTPLFIPVSNFMVHPFVAELHLENVKLVKQDSEVESIILVKLRDFLDDNNIGSVSMPMANGMQLNDVPVFNLEGHIVWGATAMMLSEFRTICKEVS